MSHIVIIGNSAAGLAAIEAIRASDQPSRVILIAGERHLPYSRITLTYLLGGKMALKDVAIHDSGWYSRQSVQPLLEHYATQVDTSRQTVLADHNGKTVRVLYDRLLIATGASAQRPDLPGIDLPGVFCLRDLDDAVAINRYLETSSFSSDPPRVLFLGGGPVCLQSLAALAMRGMRATLLVRSDRILSQLADADTARLAQKVLVANRVRIITGANSVGIEPSKNGKNGCLTVQLADDRRLCTDMIIIGKGTQPNLDLTQGTSIKTKAGILVDETMQSSIPDIFAAGDVAQATHCVTGRRTCFGTWTNAVEQGRIAGLNLIGQSTEWIGGLNRNVTNIFGNTLAAVGLTSIPPGEDRHYYLHTWQDRRRAVSRRLIFRDGCLLGAVLWNECDDLGVLGSLIATERDCTGYETQITRGMSTWAGAFIHA